MTQFDFNLNIEERRILVEKYQNYPLNLILLWCFSGCSSICLFNIPAYRRHLARLHAPKQVHEQAGGTSANCNWSFVRKLLIHMFHLSLKTTSKYIQFMEHAWILCHVKNVQCYWSSSKLSICFSVGIHRRSGCAVLIYNTIIHLELTLVWYNTK